MTLQELRELLTKIVENNSPEILEYNIVVNGCFYDCILECGDININHDTKEIIIS